MKLSVGLPKNSDDTIEDKASVKKVFLVKAPNCAETLLDLLKQEADLNFSNILTLCKPCMSIKVKPCNTKQHLLSHFCKTKNFINITRKVKLSL